MKKILFNTETSLNQFETSNTVKSVVKRDSEFLKKRSKSYIDLIKKIDSKTVSNTAGMNELLEEISREFGTADLSSLPIGIVSKCFLGHPYDVHIIDLSGTSIINHYKINEKMPSSFERARTLAIHNSYAMVEVYKDRLILIREDGTAIKVD
jgi:hypothetical protein